MSTNLYLYDIHLHSYCIFFSTSINRAYLILAGTGATLIMKKKRIQLHIEVFKIYIDTRQTANGLARRSVVAYISCIIITDHIKLYMYIHSVGFIECIDRHKVGQNKDWRYSSFSPKIIGHIQPYKVDYKHVCSFPMLFVYFRQLDIRLTSTTAGYGCL